MKKRKVALVHDYLREYGGAERVLEALHELYPDAPVYVAFVDQEALGLQWQKFADWEIHQTWLARVPFIKKLFSPLRVLAAAAFADLDLDEFDLVISSSNAYMAKAVNVSPDKHLCYCHTPPRSLYGYNTMTNWKKNPLIRFGGTLINHYMRVVDFNVSRKVGTFIANSKETKRRIKKFYKRDSLVVYPPVNVPNKLPQSQGENDYYLFVGRLAFSKHPELAVASANQLGFKLKVVGSGNMLPTLQAAAHHNVEFLGAVSDDELNQLYLHARAVLFPVEDEDFGIVPVEAMGYGVPVIAHRSGGPQETVIGGKTGLLFDELTVEGLNQAVRLFEQLLESGQFKSQHIYRHAQQFSKAAFMSQITQVVQSKMGN